MAFASLTKADFPALAGAGIPIARRAQMANADAGSEALLSWAADRFDLARVPRHDSVS